MPSTHNNELDFISVVKKTHIKSNLKSTNTQIISTNTNGNLIDLSINKKNYSFCKRNIEWFSLTVTGKNDQANNLVHSPSCCGLPHYNPKIFNNKKLCGYSLAGIPCPFDKKCNMIHPDNFPQITKTDKNLEKTISVNNKTYNSAGVLIITEDDNDNYVVLFKSNTLVNRGPNIGNYYYGIAGGGINNKDLDVESAAKRELYEESCKTVIIPEKILSDYKHNNSYVEIIGKTLSGHRKPGLFACYICNLTNISNCMKYYYSNNKSIIENSNIDYVYNETQDVDKFSINLIEKAIHHLNYSEIKPMVINNSEGEPKFIDERTLKCMWKIINDSDINIYSKKIESYEMITDNKINTFNFNNLSL